MGQSVIFSRLQRVQQTSEWPTWTVAVTLYAAWAFLTRYANTLPAPLVAALGGLLVAWHGSLQHETIHGHPTRIPWLNACVGGVPLSLWLPFSAYRESHLRHHATDALTDPFSDPESFYVPESTYRAMPTWRRAWLRAQQSLVGRMVLGPPHLVFRFYEDALCSIFQKRDTLGPRAAASGWVGHAIGVALVVGWLHFVCHLSVVKYVALFVYPGLALTLLRSFIEHRPGTTRDDSTAIVERAGLLGLLFLNNNLHLVHHLSPSLPWYELPRRYQERRELYRARTGGHFFSGYGSILRAYALRPKDVPYR